MEVEPSTWYSSRDTHPSIDPAHWRLTSQSCLCSNHHSTWALNYRQFVFRWYSTPPSRLWIFAFGRSNSWWKGQCRRQGSQKHTTYIPRAPLHWNHDFTLHYHFLHGCIIHKCNVHPCEKIMGLFVWSQIWSRSQDIASLSLICAKSSIVEVKCAKYLSTVISRDRVITHWK